MDTFSLITGSTPLLISMPHDGTGLPDDLKPRLTKHALQVPDTDWHVAQLYEFARGLGASVIRPLFSRYVVDLNRPPDGTLLYPGASNTEVCPLRSFDGLPIYRTGSEPAVAEIATRLDTYWRPYHRALTAELDRLKLKFGVAVLFDAHSIRSQVPRFFDGSLPDLNLGTADSSSCAADLQENLIDILAAQTRFSHVVNGRFKGGYITRTYGRPGAHVHAVQLEQSQSSYMNETYPFAYREDLAAGVQPVLKLLIEELIRWAGARQG